MRLFRWIPPFFGRSLLCEPPGRLSLRGAFFSVCSASQSPPSKAAVYDREGPPIEVTRLVDLPPVNLSENDVCVKMLAAPINPSDINRIEGVYPVRPPVPAIGGYEGVGEVFSLGSAVRNLSLGDWVIPSPPSSFGTWQSYIVKPEDAWHKVRKDIPMEYAATVTVNPLTALRMLEDFVDLKSGDVIVQNGATSIVGQCIIQLARARGVYSINIIRDRPPHTIEVIKKLKGLGATEVYTEGELKGKNKDFLAGLPEPILGFNCIGGNAARLVLKLLGHGGTMVTYGGMSKEPVSVSTSSFIFKDLALRGFWLQRWLTSDKTKDCSVMIDYLLSLVKDGQLKYEMQMVPFETFSAALSISTGIGTARLPKQVLKFQ
ncbi:unnamed protein product [Victoria cruziana]